MLSTFFFTKKKKDCKKEVGERAARPLSIRLCTFCADKLIKIETQVCLILTQTLELSKISCYFYKFILMCFIWLFAWTVLLICTPTERLDVKIRFPYHSPSGEYHSFRISLCESTISLAVWQISLRISFWGNTLNSHLPFRFFGLCRFIADPRRSSFRFRKYRWR